MPATGRPPPWHSSTAWRVCRWGRCRSTRPGQALVIAGKAGSTGSAGACSPCLGVFYTVSRIPPSSPLALLASCTAAAGAPPGAPSAPHTAQHFPLLPLFLPFCCLSTRDTCKSLVHSFVLHIRHAAAAAGAAAGLTHCCRTQMLQLFSMTVGDDIIVPPECCWHCLPACGINSGEASCLYRRRRRQGQCIHRPAGCPCRPTTARRCRLWSSSHGARGGRASEQDLSWLVHFSSVCSASASGTRHGSTQ